MPEFVNFVGQAKAPRWSLNMGEAAATRTGVRVHDQVVREVEVRRRRSLPDLRASGSIELIHLFGRNGPGRGRDGRRQKR